MFEFFYGREEPHAKVIRFTFIALPLARKPKLEIIQDLGCPLLHVGVVKLPKLGDDFAYALYPSMARSEKRTSQQAQFMA